MLLALGTVAVATGMLDTVVFPAALPLRAAVTVGSAVALWDGAADLAVCEGQLGRALQGLGRTGGEDIAQGGQGRRPCMRALRRS
jgi:hypothetical protein